MILQIIDGISYVNGVKLEIETIEILEDLGSNYLLGLFNYSYN